jgi:uncharacterized protein involved in exopolysaccharide biosynthesis
MVSEKVRKILNSRREVYKNGPYIINKNTSLVDQLKELQELAESEMDDSTKSLLEASERLHELQKRLKIDSMVVQDTIEYVSWTTSGTSTEDIPADIRKRLGFTN